MTPASERVKVSPAHKGEVVITGAIPADAFRRAEEDALKLLGSDMSAPGFRTGHLPLEALRARIPGAQVMEVAVHKALEAAYRGIVKEHKLRPLTPPQVTVTSKKIVLGEPLSFMVRIGVFPTVKLPDYKRLAAAAAKRVRTEKGSPVSPEEVNAFIANLRRERKDASPELTDEFARSLGAFADAADLKAKLRLNLQMEKEIALRREERDAALRDIALHTRLELPALALDLEVERIRHELTHALETTHESLADYLKKMKKTEDAFFAEERERIAREFTAQFVMQAIAEAEHVVPDERAIAAYADAMKKRHPDVPPERLAEYARVLFRDEAVFHLLLPTPQNATADIGRDKT